MPEERTKRRKQKQPYHPMADERNRTTRTITKTATQHIE
jgi:hypothetical protein